MDLLDRYLQAVGEYLPVKGSADVLAELRANLLEQMESREEELGRSLTEDEVTAILKSHGHPAIVAGRYQPRYSLIGPEVFPYYWLTLRKTFPLVLLVFAISRSATLIYGPAEHHFIQASLWALIHVLFYFAGWMTVAFAVVEWVRVHYPQKVDFYAKWDPRKLKPMVPEKEREGLPKYPWVDVVFHVLGLAWLLSIPHHPSMLFFAIGPVPWILAGQQVTLAPMWHEFYWAAVALNVLQLVFKLIAMNGAAQPWRTPMKLVEQVLGFALVVMLARVQEYLVFVHPVADAAKVHLVAMINQGTHRGLMLTAAALGAKLLWDMGQFVALRRQGVAVAHLMA